MLDSMMKIGAHRVEYFEKYNQADPNAFGFYIRGELTGASAYSRDAKAQLYAGLMLIHSKMQMSHLCGIYVDVDAIGNLLRPAYVQMKADLASGLFRRVLVLDDKALLGNPVAEADLFQLYRLVGGFELLVCRDGDCVVYPLFAQNQD